MRRHCGAYDHAPRQQGESADLDQRHDDARDEDDHRQAPDAACPQLDDAADQRVLGAAQSPDRRHDGHQVGRQQQHRRRDQQRPGALETCGHRMLEPVVAAGAAGHLGRPPARSPPIRSSCSRSSALPAVPSAGVHAAPSWSAQRCSRPDRLDGSQQQHQHAHGDEPGTGSGLREVGDAHEREQRAHGQTGHRVPARTQVHDAKQQPEPRRLPSEPQRNEQCKSQRNEQARCNDGAQGRKHRDQWRAVAPGHCDRGRQARSTPPSRATRS